MLLLFDLDGTLISSYMDDPERAYDRWQVLPRRKERLTLLIGEGHQLGIVTNQAGVAFGHITEEDVFEKLRDVLQALDLPSTTPIAVCFGHPKARLRQYRAPARVACRKPSGAMIRQLMAEFSEAAATGVIYVGDRPDDMAAAADARVAFVPVAQFFSEGYLLQDEAQIAEQR